jgi:hypothetical protein
MPSFEQFKTWIESRTALIRRRSVVTYREKWQNASTQIVHALRTSWLKLCAQFTRLRDFWVVWLGLNSHWKHMVIYMYVIRHLFICYKIWTLYISFYDQKYIDYAMSRIFKKKFYQICGHVTLVFFYCFFFLFFNKHSVYI